MEYKQPLVKLTNKSLIKTNVYFCLSLSPAIELLEPVLDHADVVSNRADAAVVQCRAGKTLPCGGVSQTLDQTSPGPRCQRIAELEGVSRRDAKVLHGWMPRHQGSDERTPAVHDGIDAHCRVWQRVEVKVKILDNDVVAVGDGEEPDADVTKSQRSTIEVEDDGGCGAFGKGGKKERCVSRDLERECHSARLEADERWGVASTSHVKDRLERGKGRRLCTIHDVRAAGGGCVRVEWSPPGPDITRGGGKHRSDAPFEFKCSRARCREWDERYVTRDDRRRGGLRDEPPTCAVAELDAVRARRIDSHW